MSAFELCGGDPLLVFNSLIRPSKCPHTHLHRFSIPEQFQMWPHKLSANLFSGDLNIGPISKMFVCFECNLLCANNGQNKFN